MFMEEILPCEGTDDTCLFQTFILFSHGFLSQGVLNKKNGYEFVKNYVPRKLTEL